MAKRSTKGLIISIAVALALVVLPITVKVVLDSTLPSSQAQVDDGAAYSERIPVEAEDGQPFYQQYLPEIAAIVVFIWMVSILLFLGFKKRKDEVA